MANTKFKVELEIEVEYIMPNDFLCTPYTQIGVATENGNAVLTTDCGSIKIANVKKFERQAC